jgi:DNA-binding MarR family transcriptional regulator
MSGFEAPNYTMVPNDFFSLAMDMSEAELKVLLVLLRSTLGYHREEIQISIRHLASETKMSTSSVWLAAGKLEARGLVERVSKNDTPTIFRVVISDTGLYRKIIQGVSIASRKLGVKQIKKDSPKRIKESLTIDEKIQAFLE